MQKKLLLIVTSLSLISFEQTLFSASLQITTPIVEGVRDAFLSNEFAELPRLDFAEVKQFDFVEVKRLIEQGSYTSQEFNWALVSATCKNNSEIVQFLLDFNQAQDEKILKRSTVDAARAIAYFCNLSDVRKIFNENKLYMKFSLEPGKCYDHSVFKVFIDDYGWNAMIASAYIGHIRSVDTLMFCYESQLRGEWQHHRKDEWYRIEMRRMLEFLYFVAKVQNNIVLQGLIEQHIKVAGFDVNDLQEKFLSNLELDDLLVDEKLDQASLDALEDMRYCDGIAADIQKLFFHKVLTNEYQRGNTAKIKKTFSLDPIFKFFVNIGLIDASKASFVTTSQDQEFITFMNDLIKNTLSLKK